MPIVSGDIKFSFSIKTGSAGNTTASAAATSLGKYFSTTEITDATLHNLFDAVTGDENAASDDEYRGIFVENAHATLDLQTPVAWLSAEVAGGADATISIDTTAQSLVGASPAQGKEIADESTAPATQTFTGPTSKGTGLSVGSTLDALSCKQIWVKRLATNSAAKDSDGVTIRVEGDTAE